MKEAMEKLGNRHDHYELANWNWGYKEQAGNVRQNEMQMFYRFDFRPKTAKLLLEYPPRIVEVAGFME